MDSLFNNIEEFKECVPWLYATADLTSFKMDIELAVEDIKEVVGNDIYKLALSGDNMDLTRRFRLPVALFAYMSYSENADVSHEEDGRKVKIDKESESLPWEWMIERDNIAMIKKANKAVDRLVAYLDENIDSIEVWRNSEQRKDIAKLFVKNATEFDNVVPIDRSRAFFLRVLPFVRSVDRDMQKYIGKEQFSALKIAMEVGELNDEQIKIVELCREIVPHLVMSKAVRRLAIKVLPDSVVTRFDSERQTMKASTPASWDLITSMETVFFNDANTGITNLQTFLKETNPDKSTYERKDTDYRHEKFFTV